MAVSRKQQVARALIRRFVRSQGGNPSQISLVAGTGLVVGVYQWAAPGGGVASTSWEATTEQAAATERAAIGL